MPLKRSRAEERLDFKTMLYQEGDDRMRIIAPTFLYEHNLSSTLTLRLEGIYNSISGASPTGAPAVPVAGKAATAPTVASPPSADPGGGGGGGGVADGGGVEDEDDEDERDDRKLARSARPGAGKRYLVLAGATPAPTPDPSPAPTPDPSPAPTPSSAPSASAPAPTAPKTALKVPKAPVEDTRVGFNLSLIKRIGRHAPMTQIAYSTESDYKSLGLALSDAVDFNKKNTTLMYGGAFTHDRIHAATMPSSETKDTVDLILGVTQLIDPETFFTVNLSLGRSDGYMNDPYKVAELNGKLVAEKRPDTKDKQILFVALNRFFQPVEGAAELSYRWYGDSFGITAGTVQLAWFQKLSRSFVLSPAIRFSNQSEADFYGVRFSGAPEFYSADYRISSLQSRGYGLKLIWTPGEKFSVDLSYDRYEQNGTDGVTAADAYPAADIITAGVRVWF